MDLGLLRRLKTTKIWCAAYFMGNLCVSSLGPPSRETDFDSARMIQLIIN